MPASGSSLSSSEAMTAGKDVPGERTMWIGKVRRLLLSGYERYFGSSLLGKTLLVAGLVSVAVATILVLLMLVVTQRYETVRSEGRLAELIDSMSAMASIACFANDATLARETADAFVTNSDVRRITIRSTARKLADAARAGGRQGELRDQQNVRRTLFSPFDPAEVVGEIVVEPNWEAIEAQTSAIVRLIAVVLIIVLTVIVGVIAVVVTVFVIRPVKSLSDRLHVMDAAAGQTLPIPQSHMRNELGRLAADINGLVMRFRTSLQAEHELHLQRVVEEKMRLSAEVFEHTQEGITITDSQNRIIAVNSAFTQITGYSEEDVLGRDPSVFASGHHDPDFYRKMWKGLMADGHWKGEVWNRCKDGQVKPEWISISTVIDETDNISNYIAIFSDISERKQAEERIEFLAHHDPLTKLPNRVLTRDRFALATATALRDKTSVAMLFVDLDQFKYVNDSFGHQAGDRLLVLATERLREHIRDADTISRQGGDEFLIILPGLGDPNAVTRIAQGMLDALATPFDIEDHTIGISASIGITLFPADGKDFDTLLKNADAAMYAAKASGKNTYRFFTEELNVDVLDRLQLKAQMRNALARKEYGLHYQPQIELATGKVMGVEALIRWNQPELGPVSPSRFIPVAEESGLINPIGEWVLEEACRQGLEWRNTGLPPMTVAVNVAAQQINRGNIFEVVQKVLERTGFPPEFVELEFTESGLLHDVAHSLETVRRLKTLGVRMAIDDFGTGYSSLSYLKKFKVGKLKIDQSFVRDLEQDVEDMEIVRAIVQMGKTLHMRVIAEGVETPGQVLILQGLGCDEAQGYHFARPLPAGDLRLWIGRRQEAAAKGALTRREAGRV